MKRFLLLLLFCLAAAGCRGNHYVFKDAAPVADLGDRQPSAMPKKSKPFNYVGYSLSSSVRYPLIQTMDVRRIPRAQDVNSLDEVPASSWYTPRLGYDEITPQEMLEGPVKVGPPQAPLKIVKAKKQGNSPGFVVLDARGKKYLIKFDLSDYPNLESTVNLVTNRLFWAFGYNVPEDFLYLLDPQNLSIDPESGVTQEDVDQVLVFAYIDENGLYRSTASLLVEGEVLGPTRQRRTRPHDSNDRIPHQNMRTLRGLAMFSAWTGNTGIRIDNSIDVYAGEKGQGHTVHYLLDFGEAMGIHGMEKGRAWDGHEHFFSYNGVFKRYFAFGFPIQKWENLKIDPSDPRGYFESEVFHPQTWKETTQFLAIRQSQPDDDYWAAKIIGSITREHLETLFKAAQNPDQDYVNYLIETLMKRRDKVLAYAFSRVSPLEARSFENGNLDIEDLGKTMLGENSDISYKIDFYNRGHKKAAGSTEFSGKEARFQVSIPQDVIQKADGYLRVEIRKVTNGKEAPRAAEFHIRSSNGTPKLAGVVH